MAEALSLDLRRRVVAAVEKGQSRRGAADRFGVSASSAIRWSARHRQSGDVKAEKQGGDRRSGRIEAQAEFLLRAVAERCDLTLEELQDKLAGRGLKVAISTIWRFFDRRQITFKKRRRTPPSRNGRT